jgi:hypothetical protein
MPRTKQVIRDATPVSNTNSGSDDEGSLSTNDNKPRATRKMTEIGAICKAKWLFYNENKSNKDIVDDWVEMRKKAGLTYQKPKVVGKHVVMIADVNFLDIKAKTDEMWEKLNSREQKKYIDKAWAIYNDKVKKMSEISV